MTVIMRARNLANTRWITWSAATVDYAGTYASESIESDTSIIVANEVSESSSSIQFINMFCGFETQELNNWKTIGMTEIDSVNFQGDASLEIILSTDGYDGYARLYNLTTTSQIGELITTTEIEPTFLTIPITLNSGSNIYGLQINVQNEPGYIECWMGRIKISAKSIPEPEPEPEPDGYDYPDLWGEELFGEIERIDDSHVRITYDWSDDTQLLDWVEYPNTSVWNDGYIDIQNLDADNMNGLIWKENLATSMLSATITWPGAGSTGAVLQTNRAASFSKFNWGVAPVSGHYQEAGGTSLWLNGADAVWHNSHGALSGTTHAFEMTTVGTALQQRSDGGEWCTSIETHEAPRLDGHVAIGIKSSLGSLGTIIIEGDIDGWHPPNGEIGIAHNGIEFSPIITLHDGFTPGVNVDVLWTFDDETTSDSLSPTKTFDEAALHHTSLLVTPWEAVQSFVVGYDGSDSGPVGDPRLPTVDGVANAVSRIWSIRYASAITAIGMSYSNITNINLSGLASLDDIEFYHCQNLSGVNLSGCSALERCCVELCYLSGTLDLSDCPALFDLRGAAQGLNEIIYHTNASPWHVCVRGMIGGGALIPSPIMWPTLGELLIYQTTISVPVIPHTDAPLMLMATLCSMPSLSLEFAPLAYYIEVNNCSFSEAQVDLILSQLASGSVNDGLLDLRNNTTPSATGLTDAATLIGRGWTVYYDE